MHLFDVDLHLIPTVYTQVLYCAKNIFTKFTFYFQIVYRDDIDIFNYFVSISNI